MYQKAQCMIAEFINPLGKYFFFFTWQVLMSTYDEPGIWCEAQSGTLTEYCICLHRVYSPVEDKQVNN